MELGLAAELGRKRAINIIDADEALPADADATIALDRAMAIDLAQRYPRATRLYAMHNADEIWLPPPEPGTVAATLAPNDRLAMLARGCAGAGEVVRIRQPIDLYRFSPRGSWARKKPSRILLLGNYLGMPSQRIDQLQTAWSQPGLEWRRLGHPEPTTAVAEEIAEADIVVGYGRSILEAMAGGRPAYVHEHSGSDGWVTTESYERMEADGFAGTGVRATPSLDQLRDDFLRYDPALGRAGQDFARTHHDARFVAAQLVALIDRLGRPSHRHDPMALRALRNLVDSRFLADLTIDEYRWELRGARTRHQQEKERLHEEKERLREEKERLREELREVTTGLQLLTGSRRYAFMRALFKPLDWFRALIGWVRGSQHDGR
jgi:hypothetical protein